MKTRGEEENSATGLNNLFPVWASMYRTAVRLWPCALLAMVWHDFDIWVEDRLAKKIAHESSGSVPVATMTGRLLRKSAWTVMSANNQKRTFVELAFSVRCLLKTDGRARCLQCR